MSAENTNAGGGETARGEKWHRDGCYVYRNEYGAVGYVDGPGSNPGLRAVVKVVGEDAEAVAARVHAALSAHSTGSAGVAAEPVAGWKLVPVEPDVHMSWEGMTAIWHHLQPEKAEEGGRNGILTTVHLAGCETNAMLAYRAMLAAAPTPPAGGGETMQVAREALGRMKARESEDVDQWADRLGADLAAAGEAEFAPASPAGDLVSLSAAIVGAMESYLRVCSSGGMPRDKRDTVEKAVKQAAKLGYFDVLAAPAAPRKGPSEEEIAKIIDEVLKRHFRSDVSSGYRDQIRNEILALLTPADRGETQAVGDGWQPISALPPRVQAILGSWKHCGDDDAGKPLFHWRKAVGCYFDDPEGKTWWIDTDKNLNNSVFYGETPQYCFLIPSPPDQNRGEPDQGGEAR